MDGQVTMDDQVTSGSNQNFSLTQRRFILPATALTGIILQLDPRHSERKTPPEDIRQLSQTIQLNHQRTDTSAIQTSVSLNAAYFLGNTPTASLEAVLKTLWAEGQQMLLSLQNANKTNIFFESNPHGYRLISTVMELMGGAQYTPWNGGEIYAFNIRRSNPYSLGKSSTPTVSILLEKTPPENASTCIVLPAISDPAYAAYNNINTQR
jgi:hypothetical protein